MDGQSFKGVCGSIGTLLASLQIPDTVVSTIATQSMYCSREFPELLCHSVSITSRYLKLTQFVPTSLGSVCIKLLSSGLKTD